MNEAHLHMVVNHFPIIGPIFGILILITGIFLKKKSVKNTAYFVLMISAIFAGISMATGEGAEEIAEKLPNVTDHIIHEHEEMAEKLAAVMYAAGIFSLISFYFNLKKNSFERYTSIVTLILTAVAIFLAIETGITGGEIRHTEIRTESVQNIQQETDKDHED